MFCLRVVFSIPEVIIILYIDKYCAAATRSNDKTVRGNFSGGVRAGSGGPPDGVWAICICPSGLTLHSSAVRRNRVRVRPSISLLIPVHHGVPVLDRVEDGRPIRHFRETGKNLPNCRRKNSRGSRAPNILWKLKNKQMCTPQSVK